MKIWIWRMHSETSSGVLGVMVYNGIISLLWWATSAFNSLNISWLTGNGVASVKWYYRIVECNILHVRLMQRIETHGKKLKIVTALKYKKLRYSSIYRCNIWYITFDMFLSYKKTTVQPKMSRPHRVWYWIHFMCILRTCCWRTNSVSHWVLSRWFLWLLWFSITQPNAEVIPEEI